MAYMKQFPSASVEGWVLDSTIFACAKRLIACVEPSSRVSFGGNSGAGVVGVVGVEGTANDGAIWVEAKVDEKLIFARNCLKASPPILFLELSTISMVLSECSSSKLFWLVTLLSLEIDKAPIAFM